MVKPRLLASVMTVGALLAGCTTTSTPPEPTGLVTPASSTGAAGSLPDGPTTSNRAEVERALGLMMSGSERYDRLIKSVVIEVGGETVAEHYAPDSGPDVTHNVFSVTKSVMSILIGIAIAKGEISGVDATLADLLPGRVPAMAPGMAEVTLRQVLSMTGGLTPDESLGDRYTGSADWTGVTLSSDLIHPAGTQFAYSSAGSHLLSAILVEATGRPVLDYARAELFDPLGIDTRPAAEPAIGTPFADLPATPGFSWPVDPTGLQLGYANIQLSAPDMIKLGRLYLDRGSWDGTPLVPAEWVQASTTAQVPADSGRDYGYQWWVLEVDGHPAFAGLGYAGQVVEVIPDLDLVVAVSCIDDPAAFDPKSIVELVATWIVPAVAG